jgi:hypothetical protein
MNSRQMPTRAADPASSVRSAAAAQGLCIVYHVWQASGCVAGPADPYVADPPHSHRRTRRHCAPARLHARARSSHRAAGAVQRQGHVPLRGASAAGQWLPCVGQLCALQRLRRMGRCRVLARATRVRTQVCPGSCCVVAASPVPPALPPHWVSGGGPTDFSPLRGRFPTSGASMCVPCRRPDLTQEATDPAAAATPPRRAYDFFAYLSSPAVSWVRPHALLPIPGTAATLLWQQTPGRTPQSL